MLHLQLNKGPTTLYREAALFSLSEGPPLPYLWEAGVLHHAFLLLLWVRRTRFTSLARGGRRGGVVRLLGAVHAHTCDSISQVPHSIASLQHQGFRGQRTSGILENIYIFFIQQEWTQYLNRVYPPNNRDIGTCLYLSIMERCPLYSLDVLVL